MAQQPGIYVERVIRGSVDDVWRLTQTPEVHQRWDLRFTRIEYLPRPSLAEPQRFLYITQLLPGLRHPAIEGSGESVGERRGADGQASSALRFGSDQPWSLIRTGSGYWRYMPQADTVRFLTWYDYEVRFGALGRLVNAAVLRPAMGWATAWSFDRLRLWVEDRQTPEASLAFALIQTGTRVTLAFVWLWHGLIPKLLFHDNAEQLMLLQAGVPAGGLMPVLNVFGAAEVGFGLLMLLAWRWRWLFPLNLAIMAGALAGVALRSPQFLTAAFNPVTLNVCVMALAAAGWLAFPHAPSAAHCRRKPKET